MPSVQRFRQFFNERLTAAAEEIFTVFEKTIVEYEEEISRQRKLLDVFLKPEVKIHRIELPQQHVCQEKAPPHQQIHNQAKNSNLDQEEPEPLQMKEEPEEICTDHDSDQLALKQETDAVMLSLSYGEESQSEDQTLHLNHAETQKDEPEPNTDHQLLPHCSHSAESQDHRGGEHEDEGSSRNTEENPKEMHNTNKMQSNSVIISTVPPISCNRGQGDYINCFKCDTCGKDFPFHSKLIRHQKSHTGLKPHTCNFCGKTFTQKSALKVHKRIHTGVKPYLCSVCGKRFTQTSILKVHQRIHTGERPYSCETCGDAFKDTSALKKHIRTHTGEKPYACNTCGKRFCQVTYLKRHEIIHTDKNPHHCKTCGKYFKSGMDLSIHMTSHTGKKPYQCDVCGKGYFFSSLLVRHISLHIGK